MYPALAVCKPRAHRFAHRSVALQVGLVRRRRSARRMAYAHA